MSASGEVSNLILLSQRKQLLSTTYVMVYLFVFLQMIINFDDALYLAGMDTWTVGVYQSQSGENNNYLNTRKHFIQF